MFLSKFSNSDFHKDLIHLSLFIAIIYNLNVEIGRRMTERFKAKVPKLQFQEYFIV